MPIIDMHFHTMWHETKEAKTPNDLQRLNMAAVKRYQIVKVVASGDQLASYRDELGERLIPGILFPNPDAFEQKGPLEPSAAALRQMHKEGKLAALAEFGPQYLGLEPASPKLEPYWALAEELDIPVGIHMGLGPRGAAYHGAAEYRMRLSNPLLLEDVLVRHPKLRVYICHAGWPFINELLGLLWAHPQVYVDVGIINWGLPEAEFHTYLRRIVDAGFSDRVMFGTDNMVWPHSFGIAISRTAAPFLSDDQKRDIFCRNAARFLRLAENVCRP